jgi:hypothetical protein
MKNMLSIRRWSMRLPPSSRRRARASAISAQKSPGPTGDAIAKIPVSSDMTRPCLQNALGVVAAALLAGAVAGGWAMSAVSTTRAAAVENQPAFEMMHKNVTKIAPQDELKHGLVGSYVVSGTDSDGRAYAGAGVVDIALAPSGALELDWDNGRQVGVAQVIGDVLVVACLTKGRTAILIMTVNPDGSLSGRWSRRTDRGQKGTETWKRA